MDISQSDRARRAWRILTELAKNRETLTYGELGAQLQIHHRVIGFVLDIIQDHCLKEMLPPLTILVVNQGGKPGKGFTAYDPNRFEEGKEFVYSYNWSAVENPFETTEQGLEWSDSELEATVDAYLRMLSQERQGNPYNKADVNRRLREGTLAGRSKASIEYRMQNISAALEELCLPRIAGYIPAKNIGAGVKDRIRSVLAAKKVFDITDYQPSAVEEELLRRVAKLKSISLVGFPRGIKAPERITSSTSSFLRDPLVKAWVLKNAKGTCEGCNRSAPFELIDGSPFLEVHHVRPLAEGGSDQISNAVALCPNCHRRCHLSNDQREFTESLYNGVSRLVPE